ncbi:peptidase MA family metallohydrolase [Rosettibacter firmus]|uniref:peptidase MA family metallohydrolase n=1 Tax=Rosettibacter firmus TaxID=3111522 RepID=UPI00336C2D6E
MQKFILLIVTNLIITCSLFAQFGQNRVQYKNHEWFYIQTKHFDIYFAKGGERIAEFTAAVAEDALLKLQQDFNYEINNRIILVVYNSHNDFQETNITDEYLGQGVGGFTEPFKNRVVFPFEGSYEKFRHVIHHELVHAVMQDMYFGGSIQNVISKGITLQLPHWFMEGSAEYFSQGWETYTDMFIRNAIISESLPDINQLTGYLGYRGGQSVFKYIADTYGRQKLGELINKIQGLGSLESALKSSIGIDFEELNERWKKSLKKEYWPDIAKYQDPDEFAKRLTDNKKSYGFYNTSPAISPQGDKIAFISDRDIFLDVYIMDAITGKVIKKIVESGKTTDFEELTVLHPLITWSPDNIRIALSTKKAGYDVITIINTNNQESYDLPFKFDGIESVDWSRDGDKLVFNAHNSIQSDIYIYNFKTNELINITNDIFSDTDPVWTPDSKKIIFASDRGDITNPSLLNSDFLMSNHNYKQLDLYAIDVETRVITRITDWQLSNERFPVVSPDGKEILFISDQNGINNIYKKSIEILNSPDNKSLTEIKAFPITNSLSEISQPSITYDGKKLVFTALYKLGYNIFMLNNPFEMNPIADSLEPTKYMTLLKTKKDTTPALFTSEKDTTKIDSIKIASRTESEEKADSTSIEGRKFFVGQYIGHKEDQKDSTKTDYSRYIFGATDEESDSARIAKRNQLFTEKLDEKGNFLVNRYKVNFSPDLIYANAGYSTLYGLQGTTILAFSDILGNHRLIGITSLQIDIKNSDYGLAYYYLEKRLDFGIEGFHTARFLYRTSFFGYDLYRFRNFGLVTSFSYPFNRFYRLDGSLSLMSVTAENLDNIFEPIDKSTYLVPALSFVHDNTLDGYTSPIEGTRYNLTVFGDPGLSRKQQSFYSINYDYRKYYRFFFDYSFAVRLSGGYSGGANPQRFFIGGTENWINRSFATQDIPIQNASDFAFLSPAMPLRGYDYAEQIGTKYSLLNLELRMPLIRYLVTGPLPLLFQNILGVAFLDAGSAWNNTQKLKLFGRNQENSLITQDLLIGTGFGFRIYMLFLWKIDIAWKWNLDKFSTPRYYISIGMDF